MQRTMLLLLSCLQLWLNFATGQITVPPVNTTAPLNSNISFTCEGGPGDLIWSINNFQIRDQASRDTFGSPDDFTVPFRQQGSSEMSMIGRLLFNETLFIQCSLFNGQSLSDESERAYVLLYGSPNPPTNLGMTTQGLDIILNWDEPFAISGEIISYVVVTTKQDTSQRVTQNISDPMAVISEPIGERDCSVYEFNVRSRNGFGISETGISGMLRVPTAPNNLSRSDIQLSVSLSSFVSVQFMVTAPHPCPVVAVDAYPVTSYIITFADQTDPSSTFSSTESGSTFDSISFIIDDSNTALQRNHFYLVMIEAMNSAGSSFSEPVPLYTTGLQSSSVVLEVNDTASVTCTFAVGSDALGCEVSFYDSSSMELLFSRNITRELTSNTVTTNTPLMGRLEGRNVVAQVAELQANGAVAAIAITPQVINISAPTTSPPTDDGATTSVNTEGTSPTDSVTTEITMTTRGSSGPPNAAPLDGNLYIVIGVAASIILVFLLLIIIAILVICSLNRRRRIRHKAELARMNSLKDNNAYGTSSDTLPITLTHAEPILNGRNNTYYEKPVDQNNAPTNGTAPVPLYETIGTRKDTTGSNPVPNPVYGDSAPKSPLVVNPVYAEAQPHGSQNELRPPKEFADVSAMNPVYSGIVSSDQFSSTESTPVRKNYESAVPLLALQDTGPRYGNAPLHAGPGIPASAALDLIKASEQGTPLRRANTAGSPPSDAIVGPPIYEEIKSSKSRTLSSSGYAPGGGNQTGFPMRSLSHTDGDRGVQSPPGFPLSRNESYGMIAGSDGSAPTSPQALSPTKNNGGSVQNGGSSNIAVQSPPPIPVKSASLSSSNPGSPTLTSERVPSEHTSP